MANALAIATTIWGLVMALAPVMQIRLILRTGDASGTSVSWISILLIGYVLWTAYGIVNETAPLVIVNIVSFTVAATLLTVIYLLRRKQRAREAAALVS